MRRPTPFRFQARLVSLSAACYGLVLMGSLAHAADAGLVTALSCRPEAAPGRVLCELKVAAPPNARLAWSDALVTEAPDFAPPLRARVAAERFAQPAGTEQRLTLAFVATRTGVGRVAVTARAVVCRGGSTRERCAAESVRLSTELRVGQ